MRLKAFTGLLIALFLVSTIGFMTPNVSAKRGRTIAKEWTFMLYAVADNNLDPFGTIDTNELEMVGSSGDVNIVVMLDLYYEEGTWIYYIEQDDDPDLVTSPVIMELEEQNTGDPSTLIGFVEYCDER